MARSEKPTVDGSRRKSQRWFDRREADDAGGRDTMHSINDAACPGVTARRFPITADILQQKGR